MLNKKYSFVLACIVIVLIAIFSNTMEKNSSRETVIISRAIDGDTLQLEDGRIVRLLNINTPEKGVSGYEEAKQFLKTFENNTVDIEMTGVDTYNRFLARVYTPEYLNLILIEKGYASKFLVQEKETNIFSQAEEKARTESQGIWVHSPFYGCFTSNINEKEEIIFLESKCGKISINNWIIKDESRKIYVFSNVTVNSFSLHSSEGKDTSEDFFWNMKTPVWNNDRDTLYLYDEESRIVHAKEYGY